MRVDRRVTDTRERARQVALRLFVERGYGATSLADIASELGITKAALYYHFPAKADLARSVFEPFIRDVDALLDGLRPGDLRPREVLTAYFDALTPHREAFQAILRDASGLADLGIDAVSARWLDRIPELLVGRDPSPDAEVRAVVAIGGLTRAVLLPDASSRVRDAAVDAALGALGVDDSG